MLKKLMAMIASPIADPAIDALYRACITAARRPVFYDALGVPDTVDGRFDVLLLHVILVMQRLEDQAVLSQQLFDILYADMDKNLRQMGVSDVSIARKMKPLLAAFYGRAPVYAKALAVADDTLESALRRNIYGGVTPAAPQLAQLTAYVRRAHQILGAMSATALLAAPFVFPEVVVHE